MEWFFANPLGLWALLGIPAVLLIHILQRQSKELTISTLFLLQQLQRESTEGGRIDRIRSSVPLWLQICIVTLLAWLLAQPRWIRPESVQPVAIVLDESASMSAFRDQAKIELGRVLRTLASSTARTEYYVVGSSLAGRNLYRGTELSGVEAVLANWEPLTGEHEFAPALRVARSAAGPAGVVILVADHVIGELPFDARLLATGHVFSNVGFTGLDIREEGGVAKWRALLRNFGDAAVERKWFLAAGTQRSPAQPIKLEPGEIRILEGGFPDQTERVSLQLEPDEFPIDDVLPILRPEPRLLFIANETSPRLSSLAGKVIESIGSAHAPEPGGPPVDLTFAGYDPLNPALPPGNAVIFVDRDPKVGKPIAGRILAEEHELVSHLNWEALIFQAGPGIPQAINDTVLVWRDDKPLIQLRQNPDGAKQLLFGFDVASSNALQLPSFVLAIHRFAESIRLNKPVLERRVLETGQPLRIPVRAGGGPVEVRFVSWDGKEDWRREIALADLPQLRAPLKAGFLAVSQGGNPLLQGTTYFADAREGDFRQAASEDGVKGVESSLAKRNTEVDMNWPLWTLLVLSLLLGSWAWMAWRRGLVEGGGLASEA